MNYFILFSLLCAATINAADQKTNIAGQEEKPQLTVLRLERKVTVPAKLPHGNLRESLKVM